MHNKSCADLFRCLAFGLEAWWAGGDSALPKSTLTRRLFSPNTRGQGWRLLSYPYILRRKKIKKETSGSSYVSKFVFSQRLLISNATRVFLDKTFNVHEQRSINANSETHGRRRGAANQWARYSPRFVNWLKILWQLWNSDAHPSMFSPSPASNITEHRDLHV